MAFAIAKTASQSILSLQSVASNSVVLSSVQSVTNTLAASVFVHFGRRSNTALTEGVEIRVEGSSKSSGDGHWYSLATWVTAIAAVTSQAVSGTVSSGQAVITMASTTGMSRVPNSNLVYIDNTTIANSEFHRARSVITNTSITVEDNLVNAQTGATVYPSAEFYMAQLDLGAVTRLRVVVNASNTGVAVAVESWMVTGDTITNL